MLAVELPVILLEIIVCLLYVAVELPVILLEIIVCLLYVGR
jgi:hypothetical protein